MLKSNNKQNCLTVLIQLFKPYEIQHHLKTLNMKHMPQVIIKSRNKTHLYWNVSVIG